MKFIIIIVAFFCVNFSFAQRQKPLMYPRFDEKILHMGFTLGVNSSNFVSYPVSDAYAKYGVVSISNKSQPGGQVGFVASLKLGSPVFRLRTCPSISFQERLLNFTLIDPDDASQTIENIERVNATNLDFPLMFQFRTARANNFAAYCSLGIQYSKDLQSQENAAQSFIDPFIKVQSNDYLGLAGIGIEFFTTYFKCGLELKFVQSFKNTLIQDNTPVSNPIHSLFNKNWQFSIIFEG